MCSRVAWPRSSAVRSRMPLPASRINSVPSSPMTCRQDVFPPTASVSGPGAGIEPRTPQNLTRIKLGGFVHGYRPKHNDRALVAAGARQRQRAAFHFLKPRLRPDEEPPVRGPRFPDRGGERQLLPRYGVTLGVEGAVTGVPFLGLEHSDFLERGANQLARRLVEEHKPAVRVDEDRGQPEDRNQVARQDQLEGALDQLVT